MKQTWDKLGTDIHTLKDELELLLEMLPVSQKFIKQKGTVNKAFSRFVLSVKAMDSFVLPIKSVDVISPLLKHADFSATWKFWKDYMIEQHGIHLRSRTEVMQLKKINKLCDGKAETAVYYLEYAMYRNTKSFFKVNEAEMAHFFSKDTTSSTVKTTVKLSKKYHQVTLEKASKDETNAK